MEVLISIAIMAIGLLSVAALIPVGGIQAQRAEIEQRKADLGLNAFRDFKTRGMGAVDPQAKCPWGRYSGSNWIQYFSAPAPTAPNDCLPLCIDPLMVAAAGTANASSVQKFPANGTSGLAMDRLTLSMASTISGSTFTPNYALADAIFRADDDIAIYQPTDNRLPPELYNPDPKVTPTAPSKHDSAGLYSWLATLTPYYPDQAESASCAGNAMHAVDRNLLSSRAAEFFDGRQRF